MIHRIEVTPRQHAPAHLTDARGSVDPLSEALRREIAARTDLDPGQITPGRLYLIDSAEPAEALDRAASELLADPVTENYQTGIPRNPDNRPDKRIEIHLKPGVTDPVAQSTQDALAEMGLSVRAVRTGRSFCFEQDVPRDALADAARLVLANGVIEDVHFEPHLPEQFPTGQRYDFALREVPLTDLDDDALGKLSREGHLFLSLEEMKTIQAYFRQIGREPTDCELETLAQTWSEHCVHKTLKSAVTVKDAGGNVLREYGNLIRDTIFASTQQIMNRRPGFCLSVFVDNAGVIAFDDDDGVCFKVETHNRPSALDPYGGAATGIGGVIRDVLGTGLGAKPIANTNVFCVAPPDMTDLPAGVLHPRRILEQVVAGVRDYGNRMGIPTVNGAVHFDERYVGNPLVFCGCVGLIPRGKVDKAARRGDAILVLGGRTGRDGIHGATFSSAELTDTHADEFSHAVQIGNPIVEKKVADVLLVARDRDLFTAVTDCGAGGLSSAVGEMSEKTGAQVDLDKVPLKYEGLRYDEIWISEAQERMVLAVPPEKVFQLLQLCKAEDVEATVIGTFGEGPPDEPELVLEYNREEVCRLPMTLLHDGVPMPVREAVVRKAMRQEGNEAMSGEESDLIASLPHCLSASLPQALSSPTTASKHWIIRQYDHEVQGGSVVKPLVGPLEIGPSDAAVVRPKFDSPRGVVLSVGLAPQIEDAYAMTIAAIDEAVRNALCVGGSLDTLALLDNFCWPGTDDAQTMGTLVAACEACRDYALTLGTPFISGKDSLHNQFTDRRTGKVIRIPPTMLISAIGVVENVAACVTMDLKAPGNDLYLLQPVAHTLEAYAAVHRAVSGIPAVSRHDVSDGGVLAAVAEMCIASGHGADLADLPVEAMAEFNAGYVLECAETPAVDNEVRLTKIGSVTDDATVRLASDAWPVADLTAAWRGTLEWA